MRWPRNKDNWCVWLIEYRADNGGWYPVTPRGEALFDTKAQARQAIRERFGKEAGYRAAVYVRD